MAVSTIPNALAFSDTELVKTTQSMSGGPSDIWIGGSTAAIMTRSVSDNFDRGIDHSFWQSVDLGITNANFIDSTGDALFFTGSGVRQATTQAMDLTAGGSVSFDLILGNDINGGESPDAGEDVVLEYTTDGVNFFTLDTHTTGGFENFTTVTVAIPESARTATTQLRWRQVQHGGQHLDNWAIDHVDIAVGNVQNSSLGFGLNAGSMELMRSSFGPTLELSDLDGSNGFVINGIDAGDRSGISVSNAGDVNGDGLDDLIIGTWTSDSNGIEEAGESYVVFGQTTGFGSSLDLNTLNGSNGFVINGIDAEDWSGFSVSTAGDINGDGVDDLITGGRLADPNGIERAGESYVVFGRTTGFSSSLDLNTLDGSNGFVINGIDAGDLSGFSVSTAGDVNGDGIDDLIIGAPLADPAGESYVVFGRTTDFSGSLDLNTLNGSNGFVIKGIDAGDRSGISVSNAGDVNGDGIDDLIIGARQADPNGVDRAGESYVVFGRTTGFSSSLGLNTLNGNNGFVINGIDTEDLSSFSVSHAGDVNGDGIDDLIIGARQADPNGINGSGESYVVFGRTTGFSSSLDLNTLNGNNGFVINGIDAGDDSGVSVSTAGDINGDGIDDLIVGADAADPNGISGAGESYVIFGRPANPFGIGGNGSGITIGVLSDSFNNLGGAADDIAAGELPPLSQIGILQDLSSGNGTDEGRAMMQIIHDIAPGANLLFHTASGGKTVFADGIRALADAGADIIVDDIGYLTEPMFQDGVIAKAVEDVVKSGVAYFTAVGNDGFNAYESLNPSFNPTSDVIPGRTATLHDFNPDPTVEDVFQRITIPVGGSIQLSFQWDQPFFSDSLLNSIDAVGNDSLANGGSLSDLDIYLFDAAGETIVAQSIDSNIGSDPVEILEFTNDLGLGSTFNLVIEHFDGPLPGFIKYIDFGDITIEEHQSTSPFTETPSGTAFGHVNTPFAQAVGAAPISNPLVLEEFSSAGPTPIFFDEFGNRISGFDNELPTRASVQFDAFGNQVIIPNQPRIVAPNDINTTFFGADNDDPDNLPNFSGTSASAPYAAAVAALMMEINPGLIDNPLAVYGMLESTAIDLDNPATPFFDLGPDFASGYGLINEPAAITAAAVNTPIFV